MTAMARTVCGLIILLATFGLFSVNLQAQNNIYFPYVTNNAQTSTELILTNATGRDANISLAAYADDGRVVRETSVSVSARTQVVVGPGTFAGLQGWVLGSSDIPGVVGNVRVSATDGSAAETADAAQPDASIVLPLTTKSVDISTEIAIVNPNVVNTRVILTVYDPNGRVIAIDDSVLGPFAMRRGSLSTIFGTDKDYANASHLIARTEKQNILSQTANLIGFEVVRGFARNSDDPSLQSVSSRSDWAAFAAIALSASNNSLTFSQSSRSTNWFSLIGLVNLTGSSQTATIIYSTESNLTGTATAVSIPANGSVRMSLVDLFGPGQDSGTVRITGTGALAGFQAIGTFTGNAVGVTPAQSIAQTEFIFPLVDESGSSFTGLALFNGTSAAATIDLYLISPQGVTIGHVARLLLPQQRTSGLVREYFIEGFNQRGGFIFVRSSAPVFGTAVIGIPDNILSQLSARPTLAGFIPGPQTRFAIRGRIVDQSTGNPVSGVGVVLSRVGATDTTTTTNSNGEYFFSNLAPADYTVKPVQAGFMFAPFNPVVRIDTASRLVNFTRELAPTISSVTVITTENDPQKTAGNNPDAFAVFGTSEVSLKIDGSNFVGSSGNQTGQTVFFGSRAIPAGSVNFVDSKTVFVRLLLDSTEVLSELATQGNYGRYDITIGGQAPFTESRSNARAFYVVPPVPVLVSAVGSNGRPETYARYDVNGSGETITVTGYGFRQGAQVLFNGSTTVNSAAIDTEFITSQMLQVYLPPQALRFAGQYGLRVRNQSLLPEVSGEAVMFTILNLRPTMTSVDPATIYIGPGPVTTYNLAINGINFHAKSLDPADPGTSFFIRWMPTPYVPLENVCPPVGGAKPMAPVGTSTFVTSNQFLLTQLVLPPPNDTGDAGAYRTGTYELIATNAGPGGGCSPIKQFNVVFGPPTGAPTIDTANPLSPATRQAGTAGFNLTVFRDLGTGIAFQTDAWVNFGTVRLFRVPSDLDPNTITVFVPPFLFASPGTVPITVTNPGTSGTNGGTSNRVYLSITP